MAKYLPFFEGVPVPYWGTPADDYYMDDFRCADYAGKLTTLEDFARVIKSTTGVGKDNKKTDEHDK